MAVRVGVTVVVMVVVMVVLADGVTLTDEVAAMMRAVGVTLVGAAVAWVSPKSYPVPFSPAGRTIPLVWLVPASPPSQPLLAFPSPYPVGWFSLSE